MGSSSNHNVTDATDTMTLRRTTKAPTLSAVSHPELWKKSDPDPRSLWMSVPARLLRMLATSHS